MVHNKAGYWEILREAPLHAVVSARTNGNGEVEDGKLLSDAISAFEAEHSPLRFSYFPFATMKRQTSDGTIEITCAVFAMEIVNK